MGKIDKFTYAIATSPNLQLLLTFFIIVLIKALISLEFKSPYHFWDETVYAKAAENILNSYHSEVPPLYPFLLSIAYLFSADKSEIYHIMLLITILINTSILFPSYFILRKYCSETYSLISSTAIALLPCLFIYGFQLICENLFLPLFIFSIWFLLEAYQTKARFWIAAAILSVIFLFFTKHSGFSMIFGLVVSTIYFISLDLKYTYIHSLFKEIISSKYKLLTVIFLAVGFSLIYKAISVIPTLGSYIKYESFQFNSSLSEFFNIFNNIYSIKEFVILLLHELEYMIISSYFVIFLAAALFIIFLYNITLGKSFNILDYRNFAKLKGDKALKASIIYFIFSGVALVFAVIVFMIKMREGLPDGTLYVNLYGRDDFQIMGRYIDPLIPAIFLFGLIGLNKLQGQKKENRYKTLFALIIVYLLTILLFALTFPLETDYNTWTLKYLIYLESLIPAGAIVPIIMLFFSFLFYFSMYHCKAHSALLLAIIVFSVFISAHYIPSEIILSKGYNDQNQIGSYLETNSNDSALILMDLEDDNRDHVMKPFVEFWTRGNVFTYSTTQDPSGVYTDYAKNASYIISSKILPYRPVAYSMRGYILYKPEKFRDNRSIDGLEKTEEWQKIELRGLPTTGFHAFEYWTDIQTRWMKENGTLAVFSPDNRTAILSFRAQSFYRPRTLEVFADDNLVARVTVPTWFIDLTAPVILAKGGNTVRFYVPDGCERPNDIRELKNHDRRCLSIAVQNITIAEVNLKTPAVSLSSGFSAPESWHNILTRWMQSDAHIAVFSPDNRTAILSFRAQSFYRPRTIEIFEDDHLETRIDVPSACFVNVTTPLILSNGTNDLLLHVPEGCERPNDIKNLKNPDKRCLSIAVQNVTIA